MEIKNEEHAREIIDAWQQLPVPAQKKEIGLAIERLELSCMYYEQKSNDKGVDRVERCLEILKEHLSSLTT